LPDRSPGHPEGLTADVDGNIYVASFELIPSIACDSVVATNWFAPSRAGVGRGDLGCPFERNYIYAYSQSGSLRTSMPLPVDVVPLGMVTTGAPRYAESLLWVNDVWNGDLLRYSLPLTVNSTPDRFDICGGLAAALGGAGDFCLLNANDVGPDGRIYMSDSGAGPAIVGSSSFRTGRIFVFDPKTSAHGEFFRHANLNAGDFAPQLGVNGIAFSNDGATLYMANMSTDSIWRLNLRSCATVCQPIAESFDVFVSSRGIDGPDNIDFDDQDNLWIASGQNDAVIVVNPTGQVIRQFGGRFQGFTSGGAPRALFQPSGLTWSKGSIYVGNGSNSTLRPPEQAGFFFGLKQFTVTKITP
jgi:hypothetical protein